MSVFMVRGCFIFEREGCFDLVTENRAHFNKLLILKETWWRQRLILYFNMIFQSLTKYWTDLIRPPTRQISQFLFNLFVWCNEHDWPQGVTKSQLKVCYLSIKDFRMYRPHENRLTRLVYSRYSVHLCFLLRFSPDTPIILCETLKLWPLCHRAAMPPSCASAHYLFSQAAGEWIAVISWHQLLLTRPAALLLLRHSCEATQFLRGC